MNVASAGAIYSDILFWKFVSFGRLYDFNCSELYIFSILSYIFLEFKRTGLQTSLTIYERKLSLLIRYAWTIKFKQEFGLASASFPWEESLFAQLIAQFWYQKLKGLLFSKSCSYFLFTKKGSTGMTWLHSCFI